MKALGILSIIVIALNIVVAAIKADVHSCLGWIVALLYNIRLIENDL